MAVFAPVEEQLAIILRGAVDVEVKEELAKKLERSRVEQRPLVIKLGADPTAPDLHLGHIVVLTKLRQFQDLGHKVVFLIGDFTARIGDPTCKNSTRPPLTEDEIVQNAATYTRQVFHILDEQKTEIRFNSDWLGKLSFDDVIRLAAKYSVARMIEREEPRALCAASGKMDRAGRRRRAEAGPSIRLAELAAEAVLPGGLRAFLADDEGLGRLDNRHDQPSSRSRGATRLSSSDGMTSLLRTSA